MNIFLIRHGQSLGNTDRKYYKLIPDNQVPLTEKGTQQALAAGLELGPMLSNSKIAIYYSPWTRAFQTKDLIIKSLNDYSKCLDIYKEQECAIIHEQLYSFNHEDMQTVEYVDLDHPTIKTYGSFWYKSGNVESYNEVYQRAFTFWTNILLTHNRETDIVIVSHGIFLKALQMVIQNLTINQFLLLEDFRNCEIRQIEYEI